MYDIGKEDDTLIASSGVGENAHKDPISQVLCCYLTCKSCETITYLYKGSFHANWTKGVKLISQKMLKKIYVVQLAEYFNHANL